MSARSAARRWAKAVVIAELRDLVDTGLAYNVQTWAKVGVKSNTERCAARRRAARELIKRAIAVVEAG